MAKATAMVEPTPSAEMPYARRGLSGEMTMKVSGTATHPLPPTIAPTASHDAAPREAGTSAVGSRPNDTTARPSPTTIAGPTGVHLAGRSYRRGPAAGRVAGAGGGAVGGAPAARAMSPDQHFAANRKAAPEGET